MAVSAAAQPAVVGEMLAGLLLGPSVLGAMSPDLFQGLFPAGGLAPREALALGTLMNARGLVELVFLGVGLELGVLSPALFTMMVLMALITTFMAGPVLAVILPGRQPVPGAPS